MQKIFSTRLEEATLNELERATRKLGISKRQFLEEAIRLRAQALDPQAGEDVWSETLGAWRRSGRPDTTIRQTRQAFQRSFERYEGARPRVRTASRHARVRR